MAEQSSTPARESAGEQGLSGGCLQSSPWCLAEAFWGTLWLLGKDAIPHIPARHSGAVT